MRTRSLKLTTRGQIFVTIGALSLPTVIAFNHRDLLWLSLLFLLAPVFGLLWLVCGNPKATSTRTLFPPQIAVDEDCQATLKLRRSSVFPLGSSAALDLAPTRIRRGKSSKPLTSREIGKLSLGARYVVPRIAEIGTQIIKYPINGQQRGRYQVGPALMILHDPFRLAEARWLIGQPTELMVTPKIVPLTGARADSGGQVGDERHRAKGIDSSIDQMVREYRPGDAMRRIHWKSSAHHQELMSRTDQQNWDQTGLILLDNRLDSHRGSGVDSSFEYAVSAAASIGKELLNSGFRVLIVTVDGMLTDTVWLPKQLAEQKLLTALTDVELSSLTNFEVIFDELLADRQLDSVIAILGSTELTDLVPVIQVTPARAKGLALLLDVATFGEPASSATDLRLVQNLEASGWKAVVATAKSDLSNLWANLVGVRVSR